MRHTPHANGLPAKPNTFVGALHSHEGHEDISILLPNGVNDDLQIVNQMLAEARLGARDHGGTTQLKVGDKMFQGASLLTGHGINKKTGKLEDFRILTVNMHVHDDKPKARRCAEGLGVAEILKRFEEDNQIEGGSIEITGCDFMGGLSTIAQKSPQVKFTLADADIGNRVPPCGTCCDLLDKYGTPKTLFRILPLNDGSMQVEHDSTSPDTDHGPETLQKNQVWEILQQYITGLKHHIPADQPQARVRAEAALNYLTDPTERNYLQEEIASGQRLYGYIENVQKPWQRDMREATPEGREQFAAQVMREIHRFMIEYIQTKVSEPGTDITRATVALSRTVDENGKVYFYPGFHVEGKEANGKDIQSNFNAVEASVHAISTDMGHRTVSDIFFMDIKPEELKEMVEGKKQVSASIMSMGEGGYAVKAASRHRTNLDLLPDSGKFFFRNEKVSALGSDTRVHVFSPAAPYNGLAQQTADSVYFNTERDVATYPLNELIRYGFKGKDAVISGRSH